MAASFPSWIKPTDPCCFQTAIRFIPSAHAAPSRASQPHLQQLQITRSINQGRSREAQVGSGPLQPSRLYRCIPDREGGMSLTFNVICQRAHDCFILTLFFVCFYILHVRTTFRWVLMTQTWYSVVWICSWPGVKPRQRPCSGGSSTSSKTLMSKVGARQHKQRKQAQMTNTNV